jgi:proline iminopeptidase
MTTRDGVRIEFEAVGHGPPLVICHGGPDVTYAYLAADLRTLQQHYTLVYWHYRGSGTSARANSDTYRFPVLADDLEDLRRELNVDRISVLAHCMGGYVALEYAGRYPNSCKALILVASTPRFKAYRSTLIAMGRQRSLALLNGYLRFLYNRCTRLRRDRSLQQRAVKRLFNLVYEGRSVTPAGVKARVHHVKNDNDPFLSREIKTHDARRQVRNIACPTVAVFGELDAFAKAGARMLSREGLRFDVLQLSDVGHHPLVQANARTIGAVKHFLAEASGPGRS